MKITIAELMPLRTTMSQLIQTRVRDRDRVSKVEYVSGEGPEEVEGKTFEEISKELQEIREDYLKVEYLLAKSNIETVIEFEGLKLSIVEALEFSKQLRGEYYILRTFGQEKEIQRQHSYRTEEVTYEKTTYNPTKVAKTAEKLLKKADRLSMAIQKSNFQKEVVFENAKKYL